MSNTEVSNSIPPWQRLSVNAATAAQMMGCGKSTFFRRVRDKLYPPPARDGLWNVAELRRCRQQMSTALQHQRAPKPVPLAPGAHHLYRHFNAAGQLLYVGISFSALHRLADHKDQSAWFWSIARVEVQGFKRREDAALTEKIAIRLEKPMHNIAHALEP
jgi:hypothetical protein